MLSRQTQPVGRGTRDACSTSVGIALRLLPVDHFFELAGADDAAFSVLQRILTLLHDRRRAAMEYVAVMQRSGQMVEQPPAVTDSAAHYERAKQELKKVNIANDNEVYDRMFRVMYMDPEKWKMIEQYRVEDVRCSYWGHACPVFVFAEPATETREGRRTSRHIPHEIMFKVARRDDYRCQECGQHVPDAEVEFDHIIPHAKGGPTTVANIRLLCRTCNRKKSDSMAGLLEQ